MTKQRYNYLDRSIQDMSDFVETRVENLKTQVPSSVVRRLLRKKRKATPRNGKLRPMRILTNIPQKTKNLQAEINSVNITESTIILRMNVLRSKPELKRPNPISPKNIRKEA